MPFPQILSGKLTVLSLAALGLALGIGAFGSASGSAFLPGVAASLDPIGTVWLLALRIIVVPLVVTQLLAAVAGSPTRGSVGRLGGRTLALLVVFLMVTGIASVVVMAPIAGLFPVDPGAVAGILAPSAIPASAADVTTAAPASIGGWVGGIARANVLAASAAGQILPLLVIAAVLGRTSLRTFAKAVAPAQMVAVSTRSSLMSLPALVEGGREHLHLSPSATGFVLPLCTAVFKMSTMTAEPVRYLFLAHLFGVPITLTTTAIFLVTVAFLSFSGIGIPGGGSGFDTLPAFAAAGIPVEGLVLVAAVDTIPDIAMTIINVTGHMSVATLVTRSDRVWGERAGPGES